MNERMSGSRRALLGASIAFAAVGAVMDYSSATHFANGMWHCTQEAVDNYQDKPDQAVVQQELVANDFAQSGNQLMPGIYAVLTGTVSYVGITAVSRRHTHHN